MKLLKAAPDMHVTEGTVSAVLAPHPGKGDGDLSVATQKWHCFASCALFGGCIYEAARSSRDSSHHLRDDEDELDADYGVDGGDDDVDEDQHSFNKNININIKSTFPHMRS